MSSVKECGKGKSSGQGYEMRGPSLGSNLPHFSQGVERPSLTHSSQYQTLDHSVAYPYPQKRMNTNKSLDMSKRLYESVKHL